MFPPARRLFLGLGSNLGNRDEHLAAGLKLLESKGIEVVSRSPVYVTAPLGEQQQPDFLNSVVEARTVLDPVAVLAAGRAAERCRGRVPGRRNGPRTLDVDLLVDGEAILRLPHLVVPHPRLHERRFVLVPLADIAPELMHPVLGQSVAELLLRCPDRSRVRRHHRGAPAARLAAPLPADL